MYIHICIYIHVILYTYALWTAGGVPDLGVRRARPGGHNFIGERVVAEAQGAEAMSL